MSEAPAKTVRRPRKAAVTTTDRSRARLHTREALATLVAVMNDPSASATARISAASAVLDRGWGRPRQDATDHAPADPVGAIERARQRVHAVLREAASPAPSPGSDDGDA